MRADGQGGDYWDTMASMTSSPSAANELHGLLHVVLPDLTPGPARNVLIHHMGRLAAQGGPVPDKIVQCWWAIHRATLPARQMSGEEKALWTALRDHLVDTWSPWREGWGWQALSTWVHHPIFNALDSLVALPGAPTLGDLSTRLLPAPSQLPGKKNKQARAYQPATLMGVALRHERPHAEALVNMLLKRGIDPNAEVDSRGRVALSRATGSEMGLLLARAGARLPSAQAVAGWVPDVVDDFLSLIQERLSAWTQAGKEANNLMLADIQKHWPELVRAVAQKMVPQPPSRREQVIGVARQLRALGRLFKNDCWRPGPEGVSLAGTWAQLSLTREVQDAALPGVQVVTTFMMPTVFANGREGTWEGRSADGLPAGVWGLLMNLIRPTSERVPQEEIDLFRDPQRPWDWRLLGQALDQMSPSPLLWRAGRGLERIHDPQIKAMLPQWQEKILTRSLAAVKDKGDWNRPSTWESFSALGCSIAQRWIEVDPDQQVEKLELAQQLLELFVLGGWKRPHGERLLEVCDEKQWPVDKARLAKLMDEPLARAQGTRNGVAPWDALRLSLSLEQAVVQPTRPRF